LRQQLQQEIAREEELRNFKAQPMPILDEPDFVPQQSARSLTEPSPFSLTTDNRGAAHNNRFKIKVDEEYQKETEQRQFKAKPFVSKRAFEVAKSTRPLTTVDDKILNSDARAVRRQAWDNEMAEKLRAYEEFKKHQEIEKMERERREVEELRKSLQFKANPVRHIKPFLIKASKAPLTQPQSPMLQTKKRSHTFRDL